MHAPRYEDRPWWQLRLTRKQWAERKVKDLADCLRNTHQATDRHRDQLLRDFGLIYDAPRDMYVRIQKGLQDA